MSASPPPRPGPFPQPASAPAGAPAPACPRRPRRRPPRSGGASPPPPTRKSPGPPPAAPASSRGGLAPPPAPRRRLVLVVRGAAPLEARDLRQARVLQRLVDPVAHPLRVPPLERRHRHSIHEHFVVQVVADGQARGPRVAQRLPLVDVVAHFHVER